MTTTEIYLAERIQRDCLNLLNELADRVTREGKLMVGDIDLFRNTIGMAVRIFAMYGHVSKEVKTLEQIQRYESALFTPGVMPVE